jgi:hypothetical protein
VITESDYEKPPEEGRTVRIALILSLLVHFLLALFYIGASGLLSKLHLFPEPPPPEQVSSITSTLRLEKKPKPKPVPIPVPVHMRSQPPPPPVAMAQQPVPKKIVQVPVAPPPAPSKQHHELAKLVPHARPQPPKTVKAKVPTDTPSAPPPSSPPSEPPHVTSQVAIAQHPTPAQKVGPKTLSHSSRLSDSQIAAVESDLSKTIAQARADTNPLNVPRSQDDGGPKKYAIQMLGAMSKLRGYQGLCDPIKQWQEDGYNYYYVACNVAFDDGSLQRQGVPWPVRFRPNNDPFNGSIAKSQPLAGPLPGWQLPPGTPISKELLKYARQHGADI